MLVIWDFYKKSENVEAFFQNMLTSMDLSSNIHDHVGNLFFFHEKIGNLVFASNMSTEILRYC